MSRIIGTYNLAGDKPPLGMETIAKMCGVDEAGLLNSEGAYFAGDGRLAMACVSEVSKGNLDGGSRIGISADGRINVVWEGVLTRAEGYSDESLRQENPAEVVAHLFSKHGANAFSLVEGEYAFVVADTDKNKLYLVRDRCGLKPLAYAVADGVCYFSSRINLILNAVPQMRRLCERALYHYVALGVAPPPLSMFEGISKIAAGDYVEVSANGARHIPYWRPWKENEDISGSDEELAEELLARLNQSVSRRLDDRKTAVLLSGGMDSSAVTALVAGLSDRPLHTFTLGLDKSWGNLAGNLNELPFAKMVAKKYNTIHCEYSIGRDDYFAGIENVVARLDEPIATSEMGMLDKVCKAAQDEGIEVIFNGEGSDTILFGSTTYGLISALLQGKWKSIRKLPRMFHKLGSCLLNAHPKGHRDNWPLFGVRWNMYRLARDRVLYPGKAFLVPDVLQQSLFCPDVLKRCEGEISYSIIDKQVQDINRSKPNAPFVDHMVYRDFPIWMEEYYAVENEKVPSFYGMDVRSPIFDPSIIRFSLGTPLETKIRPDGTTKFLLRKAMESLLPRDVIYRPKVGFSTPVAEWLGNVIPAVFMETYRNSWISKQAIFRDERLEELCAIQQSGKADLRWFLLSLYVFMRWSDKAFV